MINRYIPTSNHTISHFTGDTNMVAFATHVQQLSFGALYCKFNKYNFYSIEHPYFQDFQIIENKNSSKLSFLKKNTGFFTLIDQKLISITEIITLVMKKTTFLF